MRKPPYEIDDLKAFLTSAFGWKIVRLSLILTCSRPENYIVDLADGCRYCVKCAPPGHPGKPDYFDHFVTHLQELKGTNAIQMVGECKRWGRYRVLVLKWCLGTRRSPDRLTAAERRTFVDGYLAFSSSIQRCTKILPPRDNVAVRANALSRMQGWVFSGLRRFVRTHLTDAAISYDANALRVIHGDLHHGNFHFYNGQITGFMDLEDFRLGYPADDFMRYLICAAEHLRFYDISGKRRLLNFFRELLPLAPVGEWREAVLGLLVRKLDRRLARRSPRGWLALNLTFRLGFYRKLLAILKEAES